MEEEIIEMVTNNMWNQVFMEIRHESMNNRFTTAEASKPENRCFNRYRDVLPYDHSRVVIESHEDTDYINASLVKVPRANRAYLLAQGPLSTTAGHFWLAAWQQKTKAVLMLNRVMEKGQSKCYQYWPEAVGDVYELTDVGLRLEHVSSIPGSHYTVRSLRLTNVSTEESREMLHFHYTTWPDFGVPECPDTFLEFLKAVRSSGSLDQELHGPPVVHCSAGIGRSGTFCLVDSCLVLIAKEGPESVRIRQVLLEMRNYRMGLIQTPDQLKFSYVAIAEGACQDGLIPDGGGNRLSEVCRREAVPRAAAAAARKAAAASSSESSSDSSEDELGPPPLPPPRSESLKTAASQAESIDALQQLLDSDQDGYLLMDSSYAAGRDLNGLDGDDDDDDGDPSKQQRPATTTDQNEASTLTTNDGFASSAVSSSPSPNKCILNNHKLEEKRREVELRRRRKAEERATMNAKLKGMKEKARELEEKKSRRRQRSPLLEKAVPFCVGLTMLIAGGLYFYMRN